MTVSRSIGTGAVGLGRPTPSPGRRAVLTVEHYLDGEHTHTSEHTWDGWTAADVIANRAKGWREAGSRVERDGDTLTVWKADWRSQRMTVRDA